MIWKYEVSKEEVDRRRKAFLALSIFLMVGLGLGSVIFKTRVPRWIYISYVAILLVSNLWINKFFNSFLEMKIYLSKKNLKRKSYKGIEEFLISNITKIRIKKTSRGSVREIFIFFRNRRSIFINGLDKFDEFTNKLLNIVGKDTEIIKTKEPIDYDSVFFYPVLGVLLSFLTAYLIRIIFSLDILGLKIVLYISLAYISAIGIYLVYSKPILKGYGGGK